MIFYDQAGELSHRSRLLWVRFQCLFYITREILFELFEPYSFLGKIIIYDSIVLIYFQSISSVISAWSYLHGYCIYEEGFQLNIEFHDTAQE